MKFDQTIRNFGFKENVEDNCVYAKFKNGKFIFLVLYVDDIILLVVMSAYYWRQRNLI